MPPTPSAADAASVTSLIHLFASPQPCPSLSSPSGMKHFTAAPTHPNPCRSCRFPVERIPKVFSVVERGSNDRRHPKMMALPQLFPCRDQNSTGATEAPIPPNSLSLSSCLITAWQRFTKSVSDLLLLSSKFSAPYKAGE